MKIHVNYSFFQFFILILLPGFLVCQESIKKENSGDFNYSKFKTEFEKEFGESELIDFEEKESNSKKVFSKTKLPNWVISLPASNSSVIFAIGVSDPGMNIDSAYMLATLRGKAMCALLSSSKISGLSDYFIEEKDLQSGDIISSVFKEFNKIESGVSFNNSDFSVVNDTLTNNNEVIVLVSLRLNNMLLDDTTNIQCVGELSSSYIKRNKRTSNTYRADFYAEERSSFEKSDNHCFFIVKKKDDQLAFKSYYLGNQVPVNQNTMSYFSNTIKGDSTLPSCELDRGLWYALSSVLLQSYVLNFHGSDVIQSGMTDNYTKISQDISRVLSTKEMSARLLGIVIKNNTLYLNIEFLN